MVPQRQQRGQQPQPKAPDVSGPRANTTSGPDTVTDAQRQTTPPYGSEACDGCSRRSQQLQPGPGRVTNPTRSTVRGSQQGSQFGPAHHGWWRTPVAG